MPPVWKCHRCLPVLASSATRLPSRDRREEHVAARREHAVGRRALEDLEVPHRLAGFRIERLDAGVRRPADSDRAPVAVPAARPRPRYWRPALDRLRRAHVLLPALCVREIEPAGQRAVRRRLEVGAAAKRRIDEEAALRGWSSIREPAAAGLWRRSPRSSSDRRTACPTGTCRWCGRARRSARCGRHAAAVCAFCPRHTRSTSIMSCTESQSCPSFGVNW